MCTVLESAARVGVEEIHSHR